MPKLRILPSHPSLYGRAVGLGLVLGVCAVQAIAHPEDLLPLVVAGEKVALVCAWIGGML